MPDERAKGSLAITGVTKRFGNTTVLNNLSLTIPPGAFVTLLGPSGCGKTTTLRVVAGLEGIESGTVEIDGDDVTTEPPERRPVNTVFQNYALFPHMSVFQNISYGPKIHGAPKATIVERVSKMLRLVELDGFEKRMPDQLSGGQRQRVAIARALINNPLILLLDEPLGALDLRLRKLMQSELKRIQRATGVTFIYVTHDQEEALSMSDVVAVLNEGVVEQCGKPEELYRAPQTRFVAEFVGERNKFVSGDKTSYVLTDRTIISKESFESHRMRAAVCECSSAGPFTRTKLRIEGGAVYQSVSYNTPIIYKPGEDVYIGWNDEDCVVL